VHGVTGFTAPVGDVKTMSEYVLELIRTPGLLEKFSKQAKEHAFSNFHSDKIINQYIELYQSVLNK
jgi:glycosyltransferase involved in cell wall biosynthesis